MSLEPPSALPATKPYTSLREGKRVLYALCATSFMATLMYSSLAPFFSELERDLNTSTPALGQVVTVRLLLSATLALIAGPIADRYGYRRLIVLGLLALSVSFLTVAMAQTYLMLLVTGIPGGIAGGTLSGLPIALVAQTFAGEARLKAMSYTVAAFSSSTILGIPILTSASAWIGWRGVFLACGLVALFGTVAIFRALPDDRTIDTGVRISFRSVLAGYKPLLADSEMMRLYGATFLRSIGWLGFLTYFGAFLADEVGYSTRQIGLVYMVSGVGYLIGSLVAGRRRGGASIAVFAAVMTLFTGLTVLLSMTMAAHPWLVVLGVCGVTISSSFAWVMFTALLSGMTPVGQGTTMSLNSTIVSIGSAGGGIVGGIMIAAAGYTVLAFGLAIALIGSALLILQGARRKGHA
ncbi:MAG: MFS transporter [Thermomicrobiales bacterium]|nr:MFS transporter [Thermomicrobiales bacterium]